MEYDISKHLDFFKILESTQIIEVKNYEALKNLLLFLASTAAVQKESGGLLSPSQTTVATKYLIIDQILELMNSEFNKLKEGSEIVKWKDGFQKLIMETESLKAELNG